MRVCLDGPSTWESAKPPMTRRRQLTEMGKYWDSETSKIGELVNITPIKYGLNDYTLYYMILDYR